LAVETTYTHLRDKLASVLDQVVDNREVVIVRRRGARDVAVVPADELAGLMKTAHLLRSPKNARRLLTALRRADRRKGKPESIEKLRSLLPGEREAVFHREFREDLRWRAETDRNTALRVLQLVEGRISQEHRLAYKVSGKRIDFLQARYHY
jgi:antitoxin YefM